RGLALSGVESVLKSAPGEQLRQNIRRRFTSLRGLRVLVVDDDAQYRAVLKEFLCSEGAKVREAGDGRQALAAMSEYLPDLLLLDLLMPEMDGFELLRRMRASPR